MLVILVWLTILIAAGSFLSAYQRFRDPFHPLVFVMPMFIFVYGYMPLTQLASNELFTWVSEDQAIFAQLLAILVLIAFVLGCEKGANASIEPSPPVTYDTNVMQKGAFLLGGTGLLAWLYMLKIDGGLAGAYGRSDGLMWSDVGYIRDSVYLLLAAILILLSPQAFSPKKTIWRLAIVLFATPWVAQAALGARRGPTFVLFVGIGVSWYMARNSRPSLALTLAAGGFLGLLMLFLVANRGSIYLGSNQSVSTDKIGDVSDAAPSNEYIFGIGCISASRQANDYYWGKRILAQVLVRPIPRQLWPNKYVDFGVPQLAQNGGAAKSGLDSVMGWNQVPGAAAAMVADFWVEFSWAAIPFAALWGWSYGYCWKRASLSGAVWITQYVILLLLSVYMVTQSLEAVTFRLIILSLPIRWLWRRATLQQAPEIAGVEVHAW